LPNFKRLETQGAYTFNARNDYDITVTLPNHTSMVTSRGVQGATGHNWTSNSDPAVGQTIQSNKGSYVASVFDVAHDNGLRTSVYATKTKFSLFASSYSATNGAADVTGIDNGKNKLTTSYYNASSATMVSQFAADMTANPYNYSLVHFTDPDTAGHANGWGSTAYNNALIAVDGYLASIFNLVDNNATLKGKTAIILTADHGGSGTDHSDATLPLDYTIPLMVWGPGVTGGADLYALNQLTRLDPGMGRPLYTNPIQPIRNSELGNLSLDLLNLGPIPGSTIDFAQNLNVPEPMTMSLLVLGSLGLVARRRRATR
jgi:hypothetical protein